MNKHRIYKYDNIKALLIFLVVVGHMTTDYVSDYHAVRWITLWIYSFHMPAFIFVSGLLHKKYITKEQALNGLKGNTGIRWDKIVGFLLCAYALKAFLFLFRSAIGQNPSWSWTDEPGIPWYLIVMAEYEFILFLIRRFDAKLMIPTTIILSAIIGYFPFIDDTWCLSRMINFLPIFLTGYYLDKNKLLEISKNIRMRLSASVVLIVSLALCYFGPWWWYSFRKWFTGRRSYVFMEDYFHGSYPYGWAFRLMVWAIAMVITISIVILIPDIQIKGVTIVGERSLSIYFWHRPICYWLCGVGLFPKLIDLCGGAVSIYLAIYIIVAIAMTELFSLKIFTHPAKDLQKLAAKIFS